MIIYWIVCFGFDTDSMSLRILKCRETSYLFPEYKFRHLFIKGYGMTKNYMYVRVIDSIMTFRSRLICLQLNFVKEHKCKLDGADAKKFSVHFRMR